jgi:hypothetical protein
MIHRLATNEIARELRRGRDEQVARALLASDPELKAVRASHGYAAAFALALEKATTLDPAGGSK